MVADSRIQDQCHTAEKQISIASPNRSAQRIRKLSVNRKMTKSLVMEKKMMDRAGAPNDCLDVKIVRTVLMKTWQIRFDTNFANIVLPTRWTLQSLADSASTHSSKRW